MQKQGSTKVFIQRRKSNVVGGLMHTSTDPRRGMGQKKDVLWTNIAQHYARHKLDGGAKHPTKSLETKCRDIKEIVGKYYACYDIIKDLDEYEMMKDNNILDALELYKHNVGETFVFKRCWLLLHAYLRFNIIFKPMSR